MQDNFGKKLEESRSRQGISIREAADSTKIRSDFLISLENDHGNFKMPGIYKRGFLKLYARYLKLNPEELLKEFDAYHGKVNKPNKEPEDNFGRIELPKQNKFLSAQEEGTQTSLPLKSSYAPSQIHTASDPEATTRQPERGTEENKALYVKIGLIFGGTLALFTFVAIVVSNFTQSTPSDFAQNEGSSIVEQSEGYLSEMADTKATKNYFDKLTIRGDERVHIVVRQESDKKNLFSGNVDPAKPVTVSRKGPVKIRFSNGSKLSIEKSNGQKVRPGREGIGWIEI